MRTCSSTSFLNCRTKKVFWSELNRYVLHPSFSTINCALAPALVAKNSSRVSSLRRTTPLQLTSPVFVSNMYTTNHELVFDALQLTSPVFVSNMSGRKRRGVDWSQELGEVWNDNLRQTSCAVLRVCESPAERSRNVINHFISGHGWAVSELRMRSYLQALEDVSRAVARPTNCASRCV